MVLRSQKVPKVVVRRIERALQRKVAGSVSENDKNVGCSPLKPEIGIVFLDTV